MACGSDAPRAQFISIATGGTGGVYCPYGGGIAKVLNENLSGVRASAEVTAASVDNPKLIRDAKADIAFTLADTAADAMTGRGAFNGAPVPAACLAVLYANYTHVVRLAQSGVTTIDDLRGKTGVGAHQTVATCSYRRRAAPRHPSAIGPSVRRDTSALKVQAQRAIRRR